MRYETPNIVLLDALSKPDLVALQAHPQLPLPGQMGVAVPSATSTAPSDDDTSAMVTSISTVADYPTVECLVGMQCVQCSQESKAVHF